MITFFVLCTPRARKQLSTAQFRCPCFLTHGVRICVWSIELLKQMLTQGAAGRASWGTAAAAAAATVVFYSKL